MEELHSKIPLAILLPFDYNLYHVGMIIDVFRTLERWSQSDENITSFEPIIIQSKAQSDESGDFVFGYPTLNTLHVQFFKYVIIPPIDLETDEMFLGKNRLFNEWILHQYEEGATIYFLGNSILFAAHTGLLDEKKVCLSGSNQKLFDSFPQIIKGNGTYIQKLEHVVLSADGVRAFYTLFDLIGRYNTRELIIRLSKNYKIDLNWIESRHYNEFQFVYETGDERIDLVLSKIHAKFSEITNLDDVLDEFDGSRRSFNRLFQQYLKMTPIEYLQQVRISYAKLFLETTTDEVQEIANQVGYQDTKSFRIIFSRLTGLTPLDYRSRFTF